MEGDVINDELKSIADMFDSVIQDLGPENVVQVIMDSTLNCVGVGNYIMQNYSTIFCTPCASQCLNLILEDFCKIDWVNRCILQAQSVSKFIYNQTWVLDLMKKFTGGHELVRTGITKSASNFLSLQSKLKLRSRLKHMFNSPEFSNNPAYANKPQSISCIAVLEDNDFWKAVEESVAVSESLQRVLREVTGGKPVVGSIYELMTKAKESIRTYYIMDESKCKTFLDMVDRTWHNQLHSVLHSTATFLNPSIQYNPKVKFLGHIKEEFLTVLEKLLPTPELRQDLTGQIFVFNSIQKKLSAFISRGIYDHCLIEHEDNLKDFMLAKKRLVCKEGCHFTSNTQFALDALWWCTSLELPLSLVTMTPVKDLTSD